MLKNEIAKVLALKAYLVVTESAPNEHAALQAKAEGALRVLEARHTVSDLRRRVFYNLILAELFRNTDPTPYREAAAHDGEQLAALGYADPYGNYMKIVEATTEGRSTANFGDFNSSSTWSHSWWSHSPLVESQAFHSSIAPALAAVQLEESIARDYAAFLYATSLDEIMRDDGNQI